MLEGLEISIVNLSDALIDNDNKRIDSEYFRKQFIKFFKNVPNIKPLEYFVKEGYRVVYENTKIIDKQEAIERDYPYFLQATDLNTPFIDRTNLYYVNNEEWERYPKGRIKKGEILIEVKGKIEKVAIVPEDFPERTLVTGSLFKLSVNDKISKHVLLSYLISKYGSSFKERFKTNLLISYVSKPDLYRIPIPSFSNIFQQKIDNLFKVIFESKNKSKELYDRAEEILLETVGLKDFVPSNEKTNIKHFKDSFLTTGRLDAEYYQPKYEEIQHTLTSYQEGYSKIYEKFKQETATIDRDQDQYNYTEIGDVNTSDGSVSYSPVFTEELPANGKMKLTEGNIIVSKVRPYRGAVAIISFAPENYVGSGAFTILSEKSDFKKEVLQVLLRTEVYKELIMKYNVGSSYPVVKDEDILNLPIPNLNKQIQEKIKLKIEESYTLKNQSEHLLEVAKTAVEIAIEENEETALKYIEQNNTYI